jgi:hypothetical protein
LYSACTPPVLRSTGVSPFPPCIFHIPVSPIINTGRPLCTRK